MKPDRRPLRLRDERPRSDVLRTNAMIPPPHGFAPAEDSIGNEKNITFLGRELCRSLRQSGPPSCPLWVKSRHVQCRSSCPLYTRKRHQMRHSECPLRANSGHKPSAPRGGLAGGLAKRKYSCLLRLGNPGLILTSPSNLGLRNLAHAGIVKRLARCDFSWFRRSPLLVPLSPPISRRPRRRALQRQTGSRLITARRRTPRTR